MPWKLRGTRWLMFTISMTIAEHTTAWAHGSVVSLGAGAFPVFVSVDKVFNTSQ